MRHIKKYWKEELEIKDLKKVKFCLGLQIEHLSNGIYVHQLNYIKKVLKRFNIDKTYPLSIQMVFRSLNVTQDHFHP